MKYALKFIFLSIGLFINLILVLFGLVIIYDVVVYDIMDNKQPNGEIIECQYKDPCPEGALIKIFSD
jgi:hypothetical protein